MKPYLKYAYLIICSSFYMQSCVYSDDEQCPPLSVVYEVQDKLYTYDNKKPDNLDFKDPNEYKTQFNEIVPTLYYVLRDFETGQIVREMHLTHIDHQDLTHVICFDDDLPFGKYILTTWGYIDNESQLGTDPLTCDLSNIAHEVYLSNDTINYTYEGGMNLCHLKKVNGAVVVHTVWDTFPKGINASNKTFYNVASEVDNNFIYKNHLQDITVNHNWETSVEVESLTVLPPSQKENGTKLHIHYYNTENPDMPGLIPDDIYFTVKRNQVHFIQFSFDAYSQSIVAETWVNGEWQKINKMGVD